MKYPDVFRQTTDVVSPVSAMKNSAVKEEEYKGKDSSSSENIDVNKHSSRKNAGREASLRPWWLLSMFTTYDELDWDLVASYAVVFSFLIGVVIFTRLVYSV
jgi:hypothetical protein